MKLMGFMKVIGALTLVCLMYVHVQMNIIDMAYQGKVKEKQIRALIERNGTITYHILTLTSSKNLGYRMLAEDTDMQFAAPDHIVKIPASRPGRDGKEEKLAIHGEMKSLENADSIFNILSFGGHAGN